MPEAIPGTVLHAISAAILLLLGIGLWFRHNRNVHPKIMFTAFVADLLLLIYIELTLQAVEKVVGVVKVADDVGIILWVHVAVSAAVMGLYVAMIVLGRKLLAGNTAVRTTHRNLAIIFVVMRLANFVTSFMV